MNTTRVYRTTFRPLLAAAICLGLASLAGCDKGKAAISGKVTFNGQHLTAGTISFIAGPSKVGSGVINRDGTYNVGDAPVGEVTVTVETPKQPMGPTANMPKPPPGMTMPEEMKPPGEQSGTPFKIVQAPEKYKDVATSTLKFTVEKGNQTKDFELTP